MYSPNISLWTYLISIFWSKNILLSKTCYQISFVFLYHSNILQTTVYNPLGAMKIYNGISQVSGNRLQKFGFSWVTPVQHPQGREIEDVITTGRGSEAVISSSSIYISQGTLAASIKSVSLWLLSNYKALKDL